MFVLGIIIGPALGMLGGDFVYRSANFGRLWGTVVIGLLLFALLLAPFFQVGLRAGLVAGAFLGLLLTLTPVPGSTLSDRG